MSAAERLLREIRRDVKMRIRKRKVAACVDSDIIAYSVTRELLDFDQYLSRKMTRLKEAQTPKERKVSV